MPPLPDRWSIERGEGMWYFLTAEFGGPEIWVGPDRITFDYDDYTFEELTKLMTVIEWCQAQFVLEGAT